MLLPQADMNAIDTSEQRRTFLFKGRNGAYIQLPEAAQFLLEQQQSGASFEVIAAIASRRSGKVITAAEAEAAYQKVITQIEAIESKEQALPSGFWFKFTLIPEVLVSKISTVLSVAYQPPVATGLLVFIGVALALTISGYHSLPRSGETFWIGFALFQLSLVAHEFGHSSACARYGATPSDIGFTIYLIYPAFYSDVSAAWELKRWQRVVVDFGGMFFQLAVGSVYAVAYAMSGFEPFFMANLLIAGTIVFNLNPIFKFDGHWALADALGVTNLSQQPARIIKHFWQRLRGESVQPLPWNNWITGVMIVYTVLGFGIWGAFMWFSLPWLLHNVGKLPDLATMLFNEALVGEVKRDTVFALLQSVYFTLIVGLMMSRLVAPMFQRRAAQGVQAQNRT
jgi:putative peptide zinc metalloprotease protein